MKNIAVLGSTGSIGVNALRVIKRHRDLFRVVALSANSNIGLLKSQAKIFRPKFLGIRTQPKSPKELKSLNSKVFFGQDGISKIAGLQEIDQVVLAISGNAAIEPLISAISAKKEIAIANKESLVSAGGLIKKYLKRYGAKLIPIDSEQSAIFQCLNGENKRFLKKIYLTGSGGPLRKFSKSQFKNVSCKLALKHPKWIMGPKISVDSATLMNKGLEVIEASVLFDVPINDIEVLIHPQSIVHSMVEFNDGSILSQMSVPDMRIPILYALGFPERLESGVPSVNFKKVKRLNFEKPDFNKFPCLRIAYETGLKGGVLPAVMCAADEEAVGAFLNNKITFDRIPKVIETVLSRAKNKPDPTLEEILAADKWARIEAREIIK